ncbi:MAG: hypothetical protein HFH69_12645 [Lachnospiraceae bacterium]|nr:hypothetical protein [Lachnospiraceae bacterium]
MRVKKNGFVCHLEGTWCEISNKYGVVEYGDIVEPENGIQEAYAERLLDDFIDKHSIHDNDNFNKFVVKRVAFDPESKEYIQLRAVRGDDEYWTVQVYDNELFYMREVRSGCRYQNEVLDWMRTNFNIKSGLTAEVYRSSLGDCTNGGISAHQKSLYILTKAKGPFEPQDIRECVYVEWREIAGSQYIDCKPLYFRKRWYMMGGNFLYTSDSRFKEVTKSKYPIPIHDRY